MPRYPMQAQYSLSEQLQGLADLVNDADYPDAAAFLRHLAGPSRVKVQPETPDSAVLWKLVKLANPQGLYDAADLMTRFALR